MESLIAHELCDGFVEAELVGAASSTNCYSLSLPSGTYAPPPPSATGSTSVTAAASVTATSSATPVSGTAPDHAGSGSSGADDSEASGKDDSRVLAIVGIVVGGVVAVAIVTAVSILQYKKHANRQKLHSRIPVVLSNDGYDPVDLMPNMSINAGLMEPEEYMGE